MNCTQELVYIFGIENSRETVRLFWPIPITNPNLQGVLYSGSPSQNPETGLQLHCCIEPDDATGPALLARENKTLCMTKCNYNDINYLKKEIQPPSETLPRPISNIPQIMDNVQHNIYGAFMIKSD